MTRTLAIFALLSLTACTGHNSVGVGFAISNGVQWQAGSDAHAATTLAGNCNLVPSTGHIDCDGLVIRVATPGVFAGIGWQLVQPSAPNCAGTSNPAPQIAVFSFGSLVIQPSAVLDVVPQDAANTSEPTLAVALVAADEIDVDGTIATQGPSANFGPLPPTETDPSLGVSPGAWSAPTTGQGAAGAGGATAGGRGGGGGPAGGAAVMAQYEPLCPGSTGGSVGSGDSQHGGELSGPGGVGGGALLLSAGNEIVVGKAGAIDANGRDGQAMASGSAGPGGGSGGTILLESPSVVVDSGGSISANGGKGGDGANAPGGAGGSSTPPVDGAAGTSAGGGGGAAGFIRLRTSSCSNVPPAITPAPNCASL